MCGRCFRHRTLKGNPCKSCLDMQRQYPSVCKGHGNFYGIFVWVIAVSLAPNPRACRILRILDYIVVLWNDLKWKEKQTFVLFANFKFKIPKFVLRYTLEKKCNTSFASFSGFFLPMNKKGGFLARGLGNGATVVENFLIMPAFYAHVLVCVKFHFL